MRFSLLCLLSAALVSIGCGGGYEGPPRVPVSGKVTFNGQALGQGFIFFVPDGHEGRQADSPIGNGSFQIPEELGPHEGKYKVRIVAAAEDAAEKEGEHEKGSEEEDELAVEGDGEQLIPAKYNDQTELSVDIKVGMEPMTFDLSD